jgi:hypothetical protein
MGKHRIVVSAENNPYMAWQCKLFHYSCVSRVGLTPTFVVHDYGETWQPGFREIVAAGGVVRGAPSYALTARGRDYAPRNTPGTLLHAAEMFEGADEFIVLCDPDMIFIEKPGFARTLSGEFYNYMCYEQEVVQEAARRFGVSPAEVAGREELCCGVPYVIPVAVARPLAEAWLEAVDVFPRPIWESVMYALGFAVARLKMSLKLTHLVGERCRMGSRPEGDMIHYCYSGDTWDKRRFFTEEEAGGVWEARGRARRGTILAEILTQIREARKFYARFAL